MGATDLTNKWTFVNEDCYYFVDAQNESLGMAHKTSITGKLLALVYTEYKL